MDAEMVPYLLNLAYLALLALVWPWLAWQSWKKGKYRAAWGEKFFGRVPVRGGNRPCVWFHAVSVGEVNVLAPLLAAWQRALPSCQCVISTTTATGYELAKKKYAAHTVFYCPLDFSWAARASMRRVRPTCLVLAELELWPNLIRAAHEVGAKVAIVNGRLSEHSFRGYRRLRGIAGWLLRQVDLIAVQNDEYAQRFLALGARPVAVQVTGNLKFDGAATDRRNAATLRLTQLAGIKSDDVVFLAGSTQVPEEELALAAFESLAPRYSRLRLILVPRHPDRFDEVARLLERSGLSWQRRSTLSSNAPLPTPGSILLVDTVGELGAWWGRADIAYVGGSMGPREGQNMIEPAAYGAAVSFGPRTRNFRDIVSALLACQAAVVVRDGHELQAFVERCLARPDEARQLGERAQQLVREQQGATQRTVELLEQLIGDKPAGRTARAA